MSLPYTHMCIGYILQATRRSFAYNYYNYSGCKGSQSTFILISQFLIKLMFSLWLKEIIPVVKLIIKSNFVNFLTVLDNSTL